MISGAQKLNPHLFDNDVEVESLRLGFGEGLVEAARLDERVVGLTADLAESTKMDLFAKEFPNRFVEIGVAEQNMANVASGMAAMGKIPFMSSYAVFSPGRNWEQIRTTICYNDQKVVIVGSHTGVSVGPDGGSHQALEDIALMRVLPNIEVIVPCDFYEAEKATVAAAKSKKPTYLRLSREKTPIITSPHSPFEIGKANILRKPNKPKVAIIACGPLVYDALMAAALLSSKDEIEAIVINLHTIKPLDKETLLFVGKETRAVVTVEEHQVAGGMGSAVAEFYATHLPLPIEFVGIKNEFGQSGKPKELLKYYGLDKDGIANAARKVVTRIR